MKTVRIIEDPFDPRGRESLDEHGRERAAAAPAPSDEYRWPFGIVGTLLAIVAVAVVILAVRFLLLR